MTILNHTHRAVYIAEGLDQQGRLQTGQHIRAEDDTLEGCYAERDTDVHDPATGIIAAVLITAGCVLVALLGAHLWRVFA